jgi:hypothetical protein
LTASESLRNAIQLLEIEQASKEKLLKEQFIATCESLMPVNILRNTFKDIVYSPNIIDNILGTATGLITGYLSKKIFIGASANLFKKVIGSLLQLSVTSAVAQHPEGIKSIGHSILHYIQRKKESNSEKRWELKHHDYNNNQ